MGERVVLISRKYGICHPVPLTCAMLIRARSAHAGDMRGSSASLGDKEGGERSSLDSQGSSWCSLAIRWRPLRSWRGETTSRGDRVTPGVSPPKPVLVCGYTCAQCGSVCHYDVLNVARVANDMMKLCASHHRINPRLAFA